MGLFDIFKKHKKGTKQEKKELGKCIICGKPVFADEDYKVLYWNRERIYIHRKCFKQAKKMAKKLLAGGSI